MLHMEFLVDMDILVVLAVDMTVVIAGVDMRVVIAVVVMDMMNMRSQIHSGLNMVFMMIIIIQTSVNTDLEMKLETFMYTMKLLFLMVESSMLITRLMVTMEEL